MFGKTRQNDKDDTKQNFLLNFGKNYKRDTSSWILQRIND